MLDKIKRKHEQIFVHMLDNRTSVRYNGNEDVEQERKGGTV